MAQLYPDEHPYGRRTKGTDRGGGAVHPRSAVASPSGAVRPGVLTAVIVGDIEPARAQELASRAFGGWKAPHCRRRRWRVPPVVAATARRRTVIPMMNKSQADIAYGFTAITRHDPAYYAFWLMNVAFGQYAIGGRLGDSIRERQGMAYYVSSALDANVAPGPLVIRAGVSPANVDRAVASIDEEVTRLVDRRSDAAGAPRVAPLPDRLDPARARDQRRDRGLPAGRRILRAGARLRRAAARPAERGHDGRGQRRRPEPSSIPIARRS